MEGSGGEGWVGLCVGDRGQSEMREERCGTGRVGFAVKDGRRGGRVVSMERWKVGGGGV